MTSLLPPLADVDLNSSKGRKIEQLDLTESSTLDTYYVFSERANANTQWIPQGPISEFLNLGLSAAVS